MTADHSRLDRRSFLQATGAVGTAAALGGVANAGDRGSGTTGMLVGVSAASSMDGLADDLPEAVDAVGRDEELNVLRVRVRDGGSAYDRLDAVSEVSRLDGVRYVEPDAEVRAFATTGEEAATGTDVRATANDPEFGHQYAPRQVNAPDAWRVTGAEDVTIAVVDQGVMYDHPDLEDRFGETKGHDFAGGDDDPYPESRTDEYHGTHVAGIAAATTGNHEGIAGISDATLLSARALDEFGQGHVGDIAQAVRWSADHGADVINLSLGGAGFSQTMKNAVTHALDQGSLLVAAAGNDGTRGISYPARYDEVVAVSAVNREEELAGFSQYGKNVDVTAPGVDILSCWTERGTEYETISGTSMACPVTAGVAALGKAANPDYGPNRLRQLLKESARDVGLAENEQGAGHVDAANIVGAEGGPNAVIDISADPVVRDEEVTFDASDSSHAADTGSIVSYEWKLGDGTYLRGEAVSHTYYFTGEVEVELIVQDRNGATDVAMRTVRIAEDGESQCGDAVATASFSDDLGGSYDDAEFSYETATAAPCGIELDLSGDDGLDVDLYVTLDGRTPTHDDFDLVSRQFGHEQRIEMSDEDVDDSTTLGILVDSYGGAGEFTLDVREQGRASGDEDGGDEDGDDGDGDGDDGIEAVVQASEKRVDPGAYVTLDGSASSDPEGFVVAYDWDLGDGSTAIGSEVTHSYDQPGEYEVTLTVENAAGDTDTDTVTLIAGDGGDNGDGGCGIDRTAFDASDSLEGGWDDASYTYACELDDPCQVTVELAGPDDADFDLYVNTDGTVPTMYDYDRRSVTGGSDQAVVVEDVSAGQEFGVLVDAWAGTGEFDLTVEELGR